MARTFVLMAAMTAFVGVIGLMLGGEAGLVIALGVAFAMNFFSYWNSDKAVLRMHGARPVDSRSAPELWRMTEAMARKAGMPMPALYIIETEQPNAFATGRNPENAAVAVTRGLMRNMSREEIAGVVAHELAHIKNRDTLTMTITATLAGAVSMLANFAIFFGGGRDRPLGLVGTITMMILAPLAAGMVQMAISRVREYEADAAGAAICGNPAWLASALARLGQLSAGSTTSPPNATQPRRTCSSSIRFTCRRWTAFLPRTRRSRNASPSSGLSVEPARRAAPVNRQRVDLGDS